MTLLRLATAEEGRSVLAAEDAFTRTLGSFDRSFRMRTTTSISDAELRRFLGDQALDFTAEEATVWEAAIAVVARAVTGLGGLLPSEVLIVKTTGREERDLAYTRANAIVLPAARVGRLRDERAVRLLAHELFHVASRASPPLRDATYALLGFERIAAIEPPAELDLQRMTNPDAHTLTHFVQLAEHAVIPLLMCPRPLAEVADRGSVLDTVRASLLVIDPKAGAVVRDDRGTPIVLDARDTEWSRRIGRNTAYTIHPEEVLADNLALLVRRRLDSATPVPDPGFLSAFEETIRGCADV